MNLQHYQYLDLMGVTLWQERTKSPIITDLPSIGMRCFVLLHQNISKFDTEVLTVFNGMLKVLPFAADDYGIGWLNADTLFNQESLICALKQHYPESVLLMGSQFFDMFKECKNVHLPFSLQVTYHPNELVLQPEKKRQAYQELLDFKKILEVV